MQAEIENVVRAYTKETRREEKLLLQFLSVLAVRSAEREKMTTQMAQSVYDCIRLDAEQKR